MNSRRPLGLVMKGLVLAAASIYAAVTPATAGADDASTITVRVSGLRSVKGSVFCRLFATPDGFPAKGYRTQESAAIADHSAVCLFPGLTAGTYAVGVFHDENGNGKLDTNFLGIPSEGVGTSNNKRPLIGPPTWNGSKFAVAGNVTLNVLIRY